VARRQVAVARQDTVVAGWRSVQFWRLVGFDPCSGSDVGHQTGRDSGGI